MNCETGKDYIFYIDASCPIDSCRLTICDKWGNVLHDSSDKTPRWDGSKQAEGNYFYKFEGTCANRQGFEYEGVVVLIR